MLLEQVTVSEDGTKQIQGQVICRATGTGGALGADYDARFLSYVVQVKRNSIIFDKCKFIFIGIVCQSAGSIFVSSWVHEKYSS